MRHVRTAAAGFGLALALLVVPGCAPAEEGETPAAEEDAGMPAEGEQLFLEGRLTDEGVECPAFRSDDDELYTLTGDLGGFGPGDRVRIVGEPVAISPCMQGTTVNVVEISAIEDEPPGG
jgi:hypothetical protein